jgi:hypothetical protein
MRRVKLKGAGSLQEEGPYEVEPSMGPNSRKDLRPGPCVGLYVAASMAFFGKFFDLPDVMRKENDDRLKKK